MPVRTLERYFAGGSSANEQLTAVVAATLLLLLAVEGATILRIRSLLTVHAFVGMLLIPLVALKLASTGWRALRYYRHAEEYVRRGPPHVVLRVLVAPVIILSTIVLFGTGVVLLVLDQVHGPVVGLHKASFIVWVGAMSVYVLVYGLRALRRAAPNSTSATRAAGASGWWPRPPSRSQGAWPWRSPRTRSRTPG
jgi:hypothetical protein